MTYHCDTCGLISCATECERCGSKTAAMPISHGCVFSHTTLGGLVLVILDNGQKVIGQISEGVQIGDSVIAESMDEGQILFRRGHV